MKFLSIAGTAAMFLVGGGIFTHNILAISVLFQQWSAAMATVPAIGGFLGLIAPFLLDLVFGVLAGIVALLLVMGFSKLRSGRRDKPSTGT
jgi:hypothetical protein